MAQKKKKRPQPKKKTRKRISFTQIVFAALAVLMILSMVISVFGRALF